MKKLYLFAFASVLFVIISSVYVIQSAPLERDELQVRYIIGNFTGIDVNGSALTFGEVMPGGSSTRTIILYNSHPFPVEARFYISDNLKGSVTLPEQVKINPGENVSLPVSVLAEPGKPFGEYTGSFSAVISRY